MIPATVFPGTIRFTGHKGPVYALCPTQAQGQFLSAGGDGALVRWNLGSPGTGLVVAQVGRAIFALHQAAGHRLYIGDEDGGLHVVDVEEHAELQLERGHRKGIFSMAALPGGRLAVAGGDGMLSVWLTNARNGLLSLQRNIPLSDAKLRGLALSPDGHLLAVACGDGSIHILDSSDLNEQFTLVGHALGTNSLAWHPAKPVLVSGGKDGHLRLWRTDAGFKALHAIAAHKDAIYQLAFNPHGTLLASAGRDKTSKLWDANSFDPLRRLDRNHGGHGYSVNTLLWMGDGVLLTASDDRSIVAWTVGGQRSAALLPQALPG